jgi:outer membrane protein assembly factor BamD (BamD/ComL family)
VPERAQPEAELALLLRSRNVLRRDPRAALALLNEHARRFPAGTFVEEREVLAVEALLRRRERASAFARAERFIAEHPRSTYAVRLRWMIEQQPRGGASDDLKADTEP